MRAKLIYSDVLYTASLECLNEVKNNYEKFDKHYIIVPDKYTLICEKLMLKAINESCSFKAEVISLNRLCSKLLDINEVLNKQSGVILMQRILYENNEKFNTFNNMYKKIGFAEKLYATVMQIKASGITVETFSENYSSSNLLNAKLEDLKLCYSAYENIVNSGLYDGFYKLDELKKLITTTIAFKSTAFYFAFFDFFTAKEYSIIDALISSNVFTCLATTYAVGKPNEHIYSNDVYSNLSAMFLRYNLDDIVQANEVLPKSFETLKNQLFAFNPKLETLKDESIQVYKAQGEINEIENIAKLIKEYIFRGAKYNEISIGISDINLYEIPIKEIFNKYDIPYFIDNPIKLSDTELGRFISAILKGVAFGFMEEDLKSIIFNHYFNLTVERKEEFYKFITLLKPNGLKWLSKTFQNQSEKVEEAKLEVCEKISFIKEQFTDVETGGEFVNAIINICEYFNIDKSTDVLMKKYADDLKINKTLIQLMQKFYEMLDKIQILAKNVEFDALSFLKLCSNCLNAYKINLVPQSVDCVFVGDISSSSFERKNIVFLAGLNLGKAPKVSFDLGIITDSDIDNLSSKYLIEPKISQINARNRQKLFEICLTAKKVLILSYLSSDDAGSELKPSTVITSVCKMFQLEHNGKKFMLPVRDIENDINLSKDFAESYVHMIVSANSNMDKCENDKKLLSIASSISILDNCYKQLLNDDDKYLIMDRLTSFAGKSEYIQNLKNYNKTYVKDKDNLTNAKDLFFKEGYTSASEITSFYTCPYMHFLKYGIKIKEDLPYSLNKIDVGDILHRVCEIFVKALKDNQNLNVEEIKIKVIELVKEEYKNIFELEENKYIIQNLRVEANRLMDKLYLFTKKSNFKTVHCEYKFKPMDIKNNYKTLKLKGKIDRIDEFDNRFFIIDYKTGNADFEFKDVYYGIKMQLLLYALAFSRETNKQFIGCGYFPIKDRYVKYDADIKGFRVNGCFCKDENILQNLDNTLINNENEKKQSELYNFFIKPSKDGFTYSKKVIEMQDLVNLTNYVNNMLTNAVNLVFDGCIITSPYKDGEKIPCSYCKYSGICKKDLYVCARKISAKDIKKFNIKD